MQTTRTLRRDQNTNRTNRTNLDTKTRIILNKLPWSTTQQSASIQPWFVGQERSESLKVRVSDPSFNLFETFHGETTKSFKPKRPKQKKKDYDVEPAKSKVTQSAHFLIN